MLILTALTVIAQDAADKPNSAKDNIPFGKKLPPPDLTEYSGSGMSQITNANINATLTHGTNVHDANKNTPEYYRQLFLERKKMQAPLFEGSRTSDAKGGNKNSANSNFHLVKDINALAESNPHNFPAFGNDIHWYTKNDSTSYAVLDNVIYFVADDGIHGGRVLARSGRELSFAPELVA